VRQKKAREMQHLLVLKNPDATIATYMKQWNIWNIRPKHLKKTWNHFKHTQHQDKTLTIYVWKGSTEVRQQKAGREMQFSI
jgi:hypothetical protein